jgi:hypothetical protein
MQCNLMRRDVGLYVINSVLGVLGGTDAISALHPCYTGQNRGIRCVHILVQHDKILEESLHPLCASIS